MSQRQPVRIACARQSEVLLLGTSHPTPPCVYTSRLLFRSLSFRLRCCAARCFCFPRCCGSCVRCAPNRMRSSAVLVNSPARTHLHAQLIINCSTSVVKLSAHARPAVSHHRTVWRYGSRDNVGSRCCSSSSCGACPSRRRCCGRCQQQQPRCGRCSRCSRIHCRHRPDRRRASQTQGWQA